AAQGGGNRASACGVGEVIDRARQRTVQLGGVMVDRLGVARAQRLAQRHEPRLHSGERVLEGSVRSSHGVRTEEMAVRLQCDAFVRSSWAFAMSLSAIAPGSTLKLPSAMACEMRATLSASNSGLASPALDSSAAAVLDSSTC